ncbi:fibrinogen-like protein 1 [Pseudoliparis swirei]|uniref:fibrinogen-like protein 1 n=1 Tax=Pseudoliparis swirei TaxID=2059687 RepID=UPI0024BDBB15|nr:fibrinogen-like protein 1 [Pseudoliparis swirei]
MRRLVGLICMFLFNVAGRAERPEWLVPQRTDCSQIKDLDPEARSGVYWIQTSIVKPPFKVFCEMQPDGGWTVLQRRSGGALSFDRPWGAYKMGFGKYTEDHLLGLAMVSCLTATKTWTLRVDLLDHNDVAAFAEYKNFWLGGEETAFKLHVGEYSGDAGTQCFLVMNTFIPFTSLLLVGL